MVFIRSRLPLAATKDSIHVSLTIVTGFMNLEKSVGSQQFVQPVSAPGETEKCLIMLLCSCTRKISASMRKFGKVTTVFTIPTFMLMAYTSFQRSTDSFRLKIQHFLRRHPIVWRDTQVNT